MRRRPPRLLVVAMAESVHTARWLSQLEGQGFDVHLFPLSHRPLHSGLRDLTAHTTVRRRPPGLDAGVRLRGVPWPVRKGAVRLQWTVEALPGMSPAARLARAIRRVRPDAVHAMEMQHAAYLTLEARRLLGPERFPPWIYSCWGSDLYHFGRQAEHAGRIAEVLGAIDFLVTDCERDRGLAATMGFTGTFLGVFPGPGGFDLERMRRLRAPGPPSERRVIALKGNHEAQWVGRALVALEAVGRVAGELAGHELVVYSASDNVSSAAAELARRTRLAVSVLPSSPPDEILALMGRARIAIALSVSDGTPNAMLEAMVMGALPIQSDTVSTAEWIADGDNGLLVGPEDADGVERALRRALADDALVDAADERNRALTQQRIASEVVGPQVLAAYRRALSGGDRVAFVSEYLPPARKWSGQASVLYRLLTGLAPRDYRLLSRVDFGAPEFDDAPNRLPAPYRHLGDPIADSPPDARGRERWAIRGRRVLSFARAVARGTATVRRERCAAVVAAPDRLEDLPIAWAISRLGGARFYPYLFDDYATKWTNPREKALAHRLEPFLLRQAAGIIVPNETHAGDLQERYGLEATVVRNPCDPPAFTRRANHPPAHIGSPAAIVFTGAIYDAHYGAFRNLVQAISRLGPERVRLHLYTASDPALLAEQGISGPIVFHEHVPAPDVPRLQQQADILFLPLAFDSPYPHIVRTAAPAKMAEYLAARRPVLAHAPAGSFVSTYLARFGCAVVVDESDPALLADGLHRIITDTALRERICAAAWQRACDDFHPDRARAALTRLVGLPQYSGRI